MDNSDDLARVIYDTKGGTLSLIPDRTHAERFIDQLMRLLFGQGCAKNEFMITSCLENVMKELSGLIKVCCDSDDTHAKELTGKFFERLLPVYYLLLEDAAFLNASDPASNSVDEVIITYPGFFATAVYRFAHELHKLKIPFLPRLVSEHAHSRTAIDIHPGATIGSPFAIDHGTGLVIGETSIIGKRVRIYQGATLGALVVNKNAATLKRHPTIEDDVVLYAGCTILGGNTTIGHHSVIGGNVWLTSSVAPYSIVYSTPQIKIRNQSSQDAPVDFSI
jgi:serine O-acetyltransferase